MVSSGVEPRAALPATIDPIQLAERGVRLSGALTLKLMPRLRAMCVDDAAEVAVEVAFSGAEDRGLAEGHGRLQARLRMTCQRCLEPVEIELGAEPHWAFVRAGTQHAPLTDEAAEIIEVERGLVLSELVEDELLLALPMIPMHPLEQCPARDYVAGSAKRSPFAVLKGRKPNH
jgi:uncharacterized protein